MSSTRDPDRHADLVLRIESVLREAVDPELAELGGSVELAGFDADNVAQVRFLGACASCGAPVHALVELVEKTLVARVPEVRLVEAVP